MRAHRTQITALALAVCLTPACGGDDGQGGALSSQPTVSERTWIDTSRALPRTPMRELRVVIWDPNGRDPLPLLVLAHGFGGLPEKFDAFAQTVAAAGYLVVAPAFPLTNENAPGGHEQGLSDFRNQPGDVSFLITRLLQANADPADPLADRIDAENIALLGHSLGGLTALAVTRKECCRDSRIKAVVAFAPLVGLFLNQFGTDSIAEGPPMLIVHGEADATIALQSSVELYDGIAAPKFFLGLADTGHSEALESQDAPAPAPRAATEAATIAFLDAIFFKRTSGLDTVLTNLAAGGHIVERDA